MVYGGSLRAVLVPPQSPASTCSPKDTSKTRMSRSRWHKVSPQLLLQSTVFSRKLIPRKSTALSSALSLRWIFFFLFKCVKPPRKCSGHSDLGDGHLFPLGSESASLLPMGGWRALKCTEPPAWLLLKWAVSAAECWNGPVSNGCLFSFLHIPVLLPSFSQGIFFTFLLGGSCEVRGAVWPSCWEAAVLSWLCHSHRHQPSCHSRVEGLKKKKKAKQKPPVVPGLLPSCFYFSNLKVREKKAAKHFCLLAEPGLDL